MAQIVNFIDRSSYAQTVKGTEWLHSATSGTKFFDEVGAGEDEKLIIKFRCQVFTDLVTNISVVCIQTCVTYEVCVCILCESGCINEFMAHYALLCVLSVN